MKKVGIIGFGRFGKTLYRILQSDFSLVLYDKSEKAFAGAKLNNRTNIAKSPREAYETDVVFFCVPISQFEKTIKRHKRFFTGQLLIDTLSVKVHPQNVLHAHIKGKKARALLTHPLFGPDSAKENSVNLPMVFDNVNATADEYNFWMSYFQNKGLRVVEMPAKEHDALAASSQGVTHFIGRLLSELGFTKTPIDTLGARLLHEVKEQTCNDTWELFHDLQVYNAYTKTMRLELGEAYRKLYNRLLPKRVNKTFLVFGIQGGEGSFNEIALLDYTRRHRIDGYKTKYLYTTERVLEELHKGNIDFGLFAMHNSVGGVVTESIRAVAKRTFTIVEEFGIPIRHHIMVKRGVKIEHIKTLMAHPQSFKQCKDNLITYYPGIEKQSGKGDLIDSAKAAGALAKSKLPKSVAILGPERLSELYGLKIIRKDLQDSKENSTSFLLVSR